MYVRYHPNHGQMPKNNPVSCLLSKAHIPVTDPVTVLQDSRGLMSILDPPFPLGENLALFMSADLLGDFWDIKL